VFSPLSGPPRRSRGGDSSGLELERANCERAVPARRPRERCHGSGAVSYILAGGTNARRVHGRPTARNWIAKRSPGPVML